MQNHLDITTATRDACVSGKVAGRTALTDGAACSAETNVTCATKYEQKTRSSHRVGQDGSTDYSGSFDLVGELHVCEWRTELNRCEAGKVLTVCPEEDHVVEVATGTTAGAGTLTCDGGVDSLLIAGASRSGAGTPANSMGGWECYNGNTQQTVSPVTANQWTASDASTGCSMGNYNAGDCGNCQSGLTLPSAAADRCGMWGACKTHNAIPSPPVGTGSFVLHMFGGRGMQGGIKQTFSTAAGQVYKLKFDCFSGIIFGNRERVGTVKVSTTGGSAWTELACGATPDAAGQNWPGRGSWSSVSHTFTATGPTDLVIYDDDENVEVAEVVLDVCQGR